jgi:hypothetical protein
MLDPESLNISAQEKSFGFRLISAETPSLDSQTTLIGKSVGQSDMIVKSIHSNRIVYRHLIFGVKKNSQTDPLWHWMWRPYDAFNEAYFDIVFNRAEEGTEAIQRHRYFPTTEKNQQDPTANS